MLEIDLLEEAYQHFLARYDQVNAGFGIAPKFPTPVHLAFLLRLGSISSIVEDIVGDLECENAKAMALNTLRVCFLTFDPGHLRLILTLYLQSMNRLGLHDHIGNGFARYSVTADWSLPHFEKMLYDNAQFIGVFLDAYLITDDAEMLDAALDAADYICFGPLGRKDGGFYSAEDADSYYRKGDTEKRGRSREITKLRFIMVANGTFVEGAFYVWDRKEFSKILGEQDAEICAKYWNVRTDGNVDPSKDPHDEFLHQVRGFGFDINHELVNLLILRRMFCKSRKHRLRLVPCSATVNRP